MCSGLARNVLSWRDVPRFLRRDRVSFVWSAKPCNPDDPPVMNDDQAARGIYKRFFAMVGTSMTAIFFLMYLNSYQILDHAWFSETRLFMTFIMGAAMMVVMLAFMSKMYQNRRANIAIFLGAGLLLLAAVGLVRSQVTVGGVDYMEGMIPQHSIAILTSERARIEDPRVRKLADEIIAAQRREIKEMEWLIADIRAHGAAKSEADADARPVPKFSSEPE